jgi:hypothetical protein
MELAPNPIIVREAVIGLSLNLIVCNHTRIPFTTVFDRALQRFVIHADDSEAFSVTNSPLEIIQQ